MSKETFDFLAAVTRIQDLNLDTNRTMLAHIMVCSLNFFKGFAAERGVAIESLTFDELIDVCQGMPGPPSGFIPEMSLASRIEREILRKDLHGVK